MRTADADFRNAIKRLLQSDDGLSVESEGTVFVRSLEGNNYAAGYGYGNKIAQEVEFESDIESAIDYFCNERESRHHGSP